MMSFAMLVAYRRERFPRHQRFHAIISKGPAESLIDKRGEAMLPARSRAS